MYAKYDWQLRLKALLAAIADRELWWANDGTTLVRKTMIHRRQRMTIEVKHYRTKDTITLHVYGKANIHLVYHPWRPVMVHNVSLAFCGEDPKKFYTKIERLVLRHYANYQAEDILSKALDLYYHKGV